MKKFAATVAALCLLNVGTAHATTIRYEDGSPAPRWNRLVAKSLTASPNIDSVVIWEHPPGGIAACGGGEDVAGCTYGGGRYIDITMEPFANAHFYHELGHVFDVTTMTDRQRRRFQSLDGTREYGWREGIPSAKPSEHFANAYAACSVLGSHPKPYGGEGTFVVYTAGAVVYMATMYEHRAICKLIRRASYGTGLLDYTPKVNP